MQGDVFMPYVVEDILAAIDKIAPFNVQEEWDNSGLVIGDLSCKVDGLALALDLTPEVIDKARDLGVNVIVTHHPPIISPMKKWDVSNYSASLFYKSAHYGMNVISAHTNLDMSYNGINVTLAESLKIHDYKPLIDFQENAFGLGAWGHFEAEVSKDELAELMARAWNVSWIAFYGQRERFKKVALCGGSGGEFWVNAFNVGADIYITADMKYHQIAEAQRYLTLAIVDHGQMERGGLSKFMEKLKQLPEIRVYDLTEIKAYDDPKIICIE
jgi:dinuclear metal center YbgI/SA1388 family protein